jgi:hypothetical protein
MGSFILLSDNPVSLTTSAEVVNPAAEKRFDISPGPAYAFKNEILLAADARRRTFLSGGLIPDEK